MRFLLIVCLGILSTKSCDTKLAEEIAIVENVKKLGIVEGEIPHTEQATDEEMPQAVTIAAPIVEEPESIEIVSPPAIAPEILTEKEADIEEAVVVAPRIVNPFREGVVIDSQEKYDAALNTVLDSVGLWLKKDPSVSYESIAKIRKDVMGEYSNDNVVNGIAILETLMGWDQTFRTHERLVSSVLAETVLKQIGRKDFHILVYYNNCNSLAVKQLENAFYRIDYYKKQALKGIK